MSNLVREIAEGEHTHYGAGKRNTCYDRRVVVGCYSTGIDSFED